MAAASRAAARESDRRAKFYAKQQMAAAAEDAVEEWQDIIERLSTVNIVIDEAMDWQKSASRPEPSKPIQFFSRRKGAQANLDEFTSGFWDFLWGGSEKRREKLEREISAASHMDETEFEAAIRKYQNDLSDWQDETALAKRVLAQEPTAFKEVVEEAVGSFKERLYGKSIEFQFGSKFLHVIPTVYPVSVVPKVRRKQLASGRLSETDMPAAQLYKIYQDYVAGTALGVAQSTLRLLPVPQVYVTCKAEMLNTKTGHIDLSPILSGQFVRVTMDGLDLHSVDASDALANFNHAMLFKRTGGFSPITPLTENL